MILYKMAAMLGLGLACALPAAAQKQLAGEWQGTLALDSGEAQILWHATATADGGIQSTFDNPSEGITGIKVKSLELKGAAITITVDDVVQVNGSPMTLRGTFAGTLSDDGNTITGTWTQTDPESPPLDLKLKRVDSGGTAKQ